MSRLERSFWFEPVRDDAGIFGEVVIPETRMHTSNSARSFGQELDGEQTSFITLYIHLFKASTASAIQRDMNPSNTSREKPRSWPLFSDSLLVKMVPITFSRFAQTCLSLSPFFPKNGQTPPPPTRPPWASTPNAPLPIIPNRDELILNPP